MKCFLGPAAIDVCIPITLKVDEHDVEVEISEETRDMWLRAWGVFDAAQVQMRVAYENACGKSPTQALLEGWKKEDGE